MTSPYPLFAQVALAEDLPEYHLQRGEIGTIVEHYPRPEGEEDGYSLEGFDVPTITIEVAASQIVPITPIQEELVQELSRQIDQRLQELRAGALLTAVRKASHQDGSRIPTPERQLIEEVMGEPAEHFLKRFARAARGELCVEGGTLYGQWRRWGDLTNKDVIERFQALLLGLGISGKVLPRMVVGLGVIVLHLSAKTFCEEYSDEP